MLFVTVVLQNLKLAILLWKFWEYSLPIRIPDFTLEKFILRIEYIAFFQNTFIVRLSSLWSILLLSIRNMMELRLSVSGRLFLLYICQLTFAFEIFQKDVVRWRSNFVVLSPDVIFLYINSAARRLSLFYTLSPLQQPPIQFQFHRNTATEWSGRCY